jgi:hypothetical protein
VNLVEGRECGACTACCKVAAIAASGFEKPPNTPCRHCTAGGCAIYERRPDVCIESYCGWRAYAELDDEWRPDISGVLILTEPDAPSAGGRPALKFVLLNDEPLQSDRFAAYVTALVGRGVPVSLSVLGPPGCWPVKTFVNEPLRVAIRNRDTEDVKQVLARLTRGLREGAFEHASI